MTANKFFETFNHFLVTQDSNEVIQLASKIQCFKSKSFGNGEFFHGADAPSAFRLSVNQIMKSKTKHSLEVVSRSGTNNAAIFMLSLKKGSKISQSIISLGVTGGKLAYFVEH